MTTRDLIPVLRRIGDHCGAAIPAGEDFVHYNFTPANLLSDGTAITGVIDINPPVLAGDRAFDLATLLVYLYDHGDTRHLLRARLLHLAGPFAARALTSPTWCCGKSTGRCATTPQPPPPGTTCAWPESSPPTSTAARHTEFMPFPERQKRMRGRLHVSRRRRASR